MTCGKIHASTKQWSPIVYNYKCGRLEEFLEYLSCCSLSCCIHLVNRNSMFIILSSLIDYATYLCYFQSLACCTWITILWTLFHVVRNLCVYNIINSWFRSSRLIYSSLIVFVLPIHLLFVFVVFIKLKDVVMVPYDDVPCVFLDALC